MKLPGWLTSLGGLLAVAAGLVTAMMLAGRAKAAYGASKKHDALAEELEHVQGQTRRSVDKAKVHRAKAAAALAKGAAIKQAAEARLNTLADEKGSRKAGQLRDRLGEF